MKTVIQTDTAPSAIGPYSQAITCNGMIFCSGQIAIDPKTSKFVDGSVSEQTHLALGNLSEVLLAGGSSLDNVVKTTIFLANMNDFEEVNKVYSEYFTKTPPARATVAVRTLPLNASVEIDAIAFIANQTKEVG